MKNTYRGRDGKLRFKNSGIPVHKWIARKKAQENSAIHIELSSNEKAIVRDVFAVIVQIVLFVYEVPSKEGVQIMLIQTILPLSPATQPLAPFVTILAIVLELIPLYALFCRLNGHFKWI